MPGFPSSTFYTFSSLSVLLPFMPYHRFAKALHLSCISLCSLPPIFFFLMFLTVSFPLSLSTLLSYSSSTLFPSPSPPLDIWANNQCYFIPVREQMEFQLRAWQRQWTKAFCDAYSPCPPIALLQRPQAASGPCHLLTYTVCICRAGHAWRDTVTLLLFTEHGAISGSYLEGLVDTSMDKELTSLQIMPANYHLQWHFDSI